MRKCESPVPSEAGQHLSWHWVGVCGGGTLSGPRWFFETNKGRGDSGLVGGGPGPQPLRALTLSPLCRRGLLLQVQPWEAAGKPVQEDDDQRGTGGGTEVGASLPCASLPPVTAQLSVGLAQEPSLSHCALHSGARRGGLPPASYIPLTIPHFHLRGSFLSWQYSARLDFPRDSPLWGEGTQPIPCNPTPL